MPTIKNFKSNLVRLTCVCVSLFLFMGLAKAADVPALINYQGEVTAMGSPHDGPGYFKFSIIDDPTTPGSNYWIQDGSSPAAGAEPSAHITTTLTSGRFAVKLGDTNITNMTTLPTSISANQTLYLRSWFSADGVTFEQLSPDRQLVSVPFAFRAQTAEGLSAEATISFDQIDTTGATNLVSRIVAGSGISLNPSNGVGEVTISATAAPLDDADTLDSLDSTDFALASHGHAGEEITSGTVAAARIDASIARDSEIFSTVLANDGSGSTLDADTLDGVSANAFAASGANSDITSLSGLTTDLDLSQGGTGASTAAGARTNLGAAKSGANSDITSTTVLTDITRATGGSFDINIGAAAGDDFVIDGDKLVVEGDTGTIGVGTSTPNATALLDLSSTTKGLLAPRMTTAQRDAVSSPATGLTVYNTTTNAINVYNGSSWVELGGSGAATDVACSECVDSSDITNATISNADISASAAIAASKIADGSGSGLDADTVDGIEASDFASSGANSDITSITGLTTDLAVAHGGTGASTASDARTNLGAAASGANSDITSITGLTTDLAVTHGGTGASTASAARSNLGAAASGANSDITSITGLTTDLAIVYGGTGGSTATAARTNLGAAKSGANNDIISTTQLATISRTGGPISFSIGPSGGDDFVVDTNKLVVEGDTGNVGIGTATPSTTLDVVGGVTASGVVDLGGATSLEIPNATAPALTADGQLALETDADAINIQAGSNATGGIPSNTDVALPLIQQKDITLLEPDQMQALSDAIPFFTVDAYNYPNGITITAIRLATDASSTLAINVEEWLSPTDGSPVTIDAIATSASTETTETTITDASVAAGSYVFLDLDTTDVNWAKMTIWYYVND